MPKTPKQERKINSRKLRKFMLKSFDLDDLEDFNTDLNLHLQLVKGSSNKDFVRRLIESVEKTNRLDDLLTLCKRERPLIDWNSVYDSAEKIEPRPPGPKPPVSRWWWSLTAVPLLLLGLYWWCINAGCFCTYWASSDYDTIVKTIRAESLAVNTGDLTIIEDIFAADAHIVQADPNGDVIEWFDPLFHYGPLFESTRFIEAMHTDIAGVVTGREARFISGSQGSYMQNGERGEYSNEAGNPDEEEIWELEKNLLGCWQITSLMFH